MYRVSSVWDLPSSLAVKGMTEMPCGVTACENGLRRVACESKDYLNGTTENVCRTISTWFFDLLRGVVLLMPQPPGYYGVYGSACSSRSRAIHVLTACGFFGGGHVTALTHTGRNDRGRRKLYNRCGERGRTALGICRLTPPELRVNHREKRDVYEKVMDY